jgi:hypothetical protein
LLISGRRIFPYCIATAIHATTYIH